ncbi:hypothetical protein ES705_07764 [subsurface metagenome]
MLKKVSTREIEKIKERLEAELESKYISSQRKKEVKSLIHHLETWLELRDYREREHYREVIKSES